VQTGYVELVHGEAKRESSVQQHPLGTRGIDPNGNIYRYVSAGEALSAGQVVMQAAGVANHDMDLVTAAAAAEATSVTVTLGATAATLDQYKQGYLIVNDGPGEGHIYAIAGHPAANSGATLAVRLEDGDDIKVALTTSSLCGLMANPYSSVEVYDADDIDGIPCGVATTSITSGYYAWVQTWGFAAVLVDVASTLGLPVRVSDGTDGATEPLDRDGTHENEPAIGIASLISAVSTDYGVVYLQISP
jgi:hypothetical protein